MTAVFRPFWHGRGTPSGCKLAGPCLRSNDAVWHGCGRLPKMAIACTGCCTLLLYGPTSKNIVKGSLTLLLACKATNHPR